LKGGRNGILLPATLNYLSEANVGASSGGNWRKLAALWGLLGDLSVSSGSDDFADSSGYSCTGVGERTIKQLCKRAPQTRRRGGGSFGEEIVR
jgi:hypothetical protein